MPQPTLPSPASSADDNGLRFSIRGLLFATTVMAVAAAALGLTARRLNPSALQAVYVLWGGTAFLVLVGMGGCAYVRNRLEKEAGGVVFVLLPRGAFGFARGVWMTISMGLVWIGFGVYFLAVAALGAGSTGRASYRAVSMFVAEYFLPATLCAVLISAGMVTSWWKRTIQLRENGALLGMRLLRWSHMTHYRLDAATVVLQGVDQRHRDIEIAGVAGPKTQEAVRRLVERMASRRRARQLEAMVGAEKASGLVRLDPPHEAAMPSLVAALVAYAAVLMLIAMLSGVWGRPPRSVIQGMIFGIVVALVGAAAASGQIRKAGTPLVRLTRKLELRSFVLALAGIITLYFASLKLPFHVPGMDAGLGVLCGVGIAMLAGMIGGDKIDLCENGIVVDRGRFFPWRSIRQPVWSRDGTGRLRVRSGWRLVAASVPHEHREVVDYLLREKLGIASTTTRNPGP